MATGWFSEAMLMGFGRWTFTGLLFGSVGLLILVLWRAFQARTHGSVRPRLEEPSTVLHDRHPPSEIISTRIKKGVQASLQVADLSEQRLAAEVAFYPEGEFESSARLDRLKQSLDFIRRYRSIDSAPASQAILEEFRDALSPSSSALRCLYDRIIDFENAIRKRSLDDVLVAFKGDGQALGDLHSDDPYFKAVIEVIAALSKTLNLSAADDRPYILEKLHASLLVAIDVCRKADASVQVELTIPVEWCLLRDALKNAYNYVLDESRVAIQRPEFVVELLSGATLVEVPTSPENPNSSVTLNFAIADPKHVKGVSAITVMPRCYSKTLSYSGAPMRNNNFSNSRSVIQITFETYLFDAADYANAPDVALEISYVFLGQNVSKEVQCPMPRLVPQYQLVNPFLEGWNGHGLSGKSTLFVGRRGLMNDIASLLLQPEPTFFLIHGLARTGKSSVLLQLADNEVWLKERYIPIKIHCQESPRPENLYKDIYRRLSEKIAQFLPNYRPLNPDFKESLPHFRIVTEVLRLNERGLKDKHGRVLFLFDEVQVLSQWDEGSDSLKELDIHYEFPEFLKVLRDQYNEVAAVLLAGLYSLADFDRHGDYRWLQQLGGRVETRRVTDLAPAEADDLITRQFTKQGINISPESLNRIRSYTACHAYLQVLMGYYIFDGLIEDGKIRESRFVTEDDIDRAANAIPSHTLKFVFADPWIRNKVNVRLFLAALGQMSYDDTNDRAHPGSYAVDDVKQFLRKREVGIELSDVGISSALGELSTQSIISEVKERKGRFVLRYPLFALLCDRERLVSQFVDEWLQAATKPRKKES